VAIQAFAIIIEVLNRLHAPDSAIFALTVNI
jgi:hypothetical protein